jgi:hypothetical protein
MCRASRTFCLMTTDPAARRAGAQPGNYNSLRSGLNSRRLAPFMRAYSPRCQALIRASMRHASAHALDGVALDDSKEAMRARALARGRAIDGVISCLSSFDTRSFLRKDAAQDERILGSDFDGPEGLSTRPASGGTAQSERTSLSSDLVSDDVDALAERLRPLWSGLVAEDEFAMAVARARARRTRPRAELARRADTRRAFRPVGAQPQNWNALRTGYQSKRFAPLFRRAGPQGRRVLERAMAQSVADATAALPRRMRYGKRRWDHGARVIAREWGWQRVLWALRDASFDSPPAAGLRTGWWPAAPPPGGRLTRAEATARAAELERILAPVFAGVDVAPWSRVPDRGGPHPRPLSHYS